MTQEANTALAKRADDPVGQALAAYNPGKYNILTPIMTIDRLPQMARLSVRVVQADTREGAGDAYHSGVFMKSNERAPSKVLLDKIAAAAGLTWLPAGCGRTDDGTDPYVCEWRMTGEIVDFDGTRRRIVRTKRVDFRDGSPQLAPMKPGQIPQQRSVIVELAESKAANRVIRAALSLKQKYTVEELQRPFVIPRLVPDLDMSDPVVKQMVVAQRLGAEQQLYGPPSGPALPAHEPDVIDADPGDDDEGPHEMEVLGAAAPEPEQPDEPEAPSTTCGCGYCGCQADLTRDSAFLEWALKNTGKATCRKCTQGSKLYDAKAHAGMVRP